MMTLSDEESNRRNDFNVDFKTNEIKNSEIVLRAWLVDKTPIQYSNQYEPKESDWLDYDEYFILSPAYIHYYKWRLKPTMKNQIESHEAKKILIAWYFDGAKIQYSGKTNPTEDDWNDYTKSEYPNKNTFVQYKWRLKPEEVPVKRCRVALVKSDGIAKPLLVMDYDSSQVLMNQKCNEQFIKWLTEWTFWKDE